MGPWASQVHPCAGSELALADAGPDQSASPIPPSRPLLIRDWGCGARDGLSDREGVTGRCRETGNPGPG